MDLFKAIDILKHHKTFAELDIANGRAGQEMFDYADALDAVLNYTCDSIRSFLEKVQS